MPREQTGAHSPDEVLGCAKIGAYPEIQESWRLQNQCSQSTSTTEEKNEEPIPGSEFSSLDHQERPPALFVSDYESAEFSLGDGVRNLSEDDVSDTSSDSGSDSGTDSGDRDQTELSLDDQLQFALTDTLETAAEDPPLPYEAAWTRLDSTCQQLVDEASNGEADQSEVSLTQTPPSPGKQSEEKSAPVRWAPETIPSVPKEKPPLAPKPVTKTETAKNFIFQRNPGMAIAAGVMAFMALASGYAITNGVAGTLKDVNDLWSLNRAGILTSWFAQPQPVAQELPFAENIRFAKLVKRAQSGTEIVSDFNQEVVLARMSFAEPVSRLEEDKYIKTKQNEYKSRQIEQARLSTKSSKEPPRIDELDQKPAFEFNSRSNPAMVLEETSQSPRSSENTEAVWDKVDSDMIAGNAPENQIKPVPTETLGGSKTIEPSKEVLIAKASFADKVRSSNRLALEDMREAFKTVRGLDLLNQGQREQLIVKLAQGECLVPALSEHFEKVPVVTMRDLAQFIDIDC